jgi:hypothetical protein
LREKIIKSAQENSCALRFKGELNNIGYSIRRNSAVCIGHPVFISYWWNVVHVTRFERTRNGYRIRGGEGRIIYDEFHRGNL